MGLHFSSYVLQQCATLKLYSMKIKEQTRKLAADCSKHCFEVVDETDEVSSKHSFEVVDRTDEVSNHTYGKATLTSIKWFVLERLELKDARRKSIW